MTDYNLREIIGWGYKADCTSGLKLNSWRATALQSLAPTHSCLEVSSDHEELD